MLLLMYLLDWYAERSGVVPDPFQPGKSRRVFCLLCLYGLAYALWLYIVIRILALIIVWRA